MAHVATALLDEAVAEVFLVMLGHVCTLAGDEVAGAEHLRATVTFSGSLAGQCALHLERAAAIELTEALLGLPVDDELLLHDTAGELCNMIAGSWKSRLPAPQSACELSPPAVSRAPQPQAADTDLRRSYRFAQHTLQLELFLS